MKKVTLAVLFFACSGLLFAQTSLGNNRPGTFVFQPNEMGTYFPLVIIPSNSPPPVFAYVIVQNDPANPASAVVHLAYGGPATAASTNLTASYTLPVGHSIVVKAWFPQSLFAEAESTSGTQVILNFQVVGLYVSVPPY